MSLVLDASVTLAWIYRDEISESVTKTFESVFSHGAWVPSLWRLEVANGLQLADRFGLTVYDASYLELAQRMQLPLATLDRRLQSAAAGAGVELVGQ